LFDKDYILSGQIADKAFLVLKGAWREMIQNRHSRLPAAGLAIILLVSSFGALLPASPSGGARSNTPEGRDDDVANNDDFMTAEQFGNDTFLDGTTGMGDVHRIDIYILKNVPAGMVINASLEITNFNTQPGQGQCLLLEGWNRYHMDHLAWSNREDQPVRRVWEAISFLCVVTGDYYISVKPIAGSGTISYTLHVRSFDAPDITGKVGTGGAYGQTIAGTASSEKWYPNQWYKFQLEGEQNGMNEYFYANMTVPGAPDQRLLADLYVRNLEPETFSYWLNHSWWLDSFCQYEEVHAAACRPGMNWYYLTVQAYNSSGGRSENFELRTTRTLIETDGDDHPKTATPLTCEPGKTTVSRWGNLSRGTDMFDWYKAYLTKGDALRANLTLLEKSCSIFRLSIYRDNKTSALPEPGYDLMSSWTNKPAETLLNKVSALATNVAQEGWYYIGAIAQIGLVPSNVSLLADWTVQSAWASYRLDITLPDHTQAPFVSNPLDVVYLDEDTSFSGIRLLDTGQNGGIFSDTDIDTEWGDRLSFDLMADPALNATIGADPESTVTFSPRKDWNGRTNVTFTATDLYGKRASLKLQVDVMPVGDSPVVRARLPDFSVTELSTNETMTGIDLDNCFSDPDFPPFGQDDLTYTIDNGSFPATITGSRLDFGEAPDYPGYGNTTLTVAVTATDLTSRAVSDELVIYVIDREPGGPPPEPKLPPVFDDANATFEFEAGQPCVIDLNRLFADPQGGPLGFEYLGGASPDLDVALEPNGTVRLTPGPAYVPAEETLLFRATSTSGKNATGEIKVRLLPAPNAPPRPVQGSLFPDPALESRVNEGRPISFGCCATDPDNGPAPLSCAWSVDGAVVPGWTGWSFTWTPEFNQSGTHAIRAVVSDGNASIQIRWSVLVLDVNRPPVITAAHPSGPVAARAGAVVDFVASATDPDGDPLEFAWSLPDGTVLKSETASSSSFSRVVQGGENLTIILRVTDGRGGEATLTFSAGAPAPVVRKDEPTVDSLSAVYPLAAVFMAVTAGSAAVFWLARRRR
jgi:hypothetical protein